MLSVAQKTPNITPNIDKILFQVMCEQYRQIHSTIQSESDGFFKRRQGERAWSDDPQRELVAVLLMRYNLNFTLSQNAPPTHT